MYTYSVHLGDTHWSIVSYRILSNSYGLSVSSPRHLPTKQLLFARCSPYGIHPQERWVWIASFVSHTNKMAGCFKFFIFYNHFLTINSVTFPLLYITYTTCENKLCTVDTILVLVAAAAVTITALSPQTYFHMLYKHSSYLIKRTINDVHKLKRTTTNK